jgi:hypothetical protein
MGVLFNFACDDPVYRSKSVHQFQGVAGITGNIGLPGTNGCAI